MCYSKKYGKVMLSARFESGQIDPTNPARAIFTDTDCEPEMREILAKRLRSELEYGNPAHEPKIMVHLRRDWINDTAIPGLEVDFDNLTVSCDWRGLHSATFREERELMRRKAAWYREQKSGFAAMKAQVDNGKMDQMDMLDRALMTFGKSWDDQRKVLRRERICREVLENEGVKWTWYGNEDA